MTTNFLLFSPSYNQRVGENNKKRRVIVVSQVYADFTGKDGWIGKSVALAHRAGLTDTTAQMVEDDLLLYRKAWLWLKGDETTRREFERRRGHASFTGVRNLLADGIDTWKKMERRMKKPKIKIYLGGGDVRLTTQRGAIIIATLRVLTRATGLTLSVRELITATQKDVRAITKNGSFQLNIQVYFHVLRHMEAEKYLSITYKDSGTKIASVKMLTK